MELVEIYTRSYFEDMDALGVVRPNISPRASAHIPEQIEWIKTLIEKGYAYEVDGNVYFSVEKFPEYGKLSGRKVEELEAQARGWRSGGKAPSGGLRPLEAGGARSTSCAGHPHGAGATPAGILSAPSWRPNTWGRPLTFTAAVWRTSSPTTSAKSPRQRPSPANPLPATGFSPAPLTVDGVKMSKSLGNFLTIKDALKLYRPEVIRAFILSAHYRGTLDYSREAMQAAEQGIRRLHNTVRAVRLRMKADGHGRGHRRSLLYEQPGSVPGGVPFGNGR